MDFSDLGAIPISNSFSSLEQQNGLPSGVMSAVMQTESSGNNDATGTSGERGLFQFMPATAASYNIDPTNPIQSSHAAAQLLGHLYSESGGDLDATLRGYNAGEGHMFNPNISGKYIQKVKDNMNPQTTDQNINSNDFSDLGATPIQNNSQSADFSDLGATPIQANPTPIPPTMGQSAATGFASGALGLATGAENLGTTALNKMGMDVQPTHDTGQDLLNAIIAKAAPSSLGNVTQQQVAPITQNMMSANPITSGTANIAGQIAPILATGGMSMGPMAMAGRGLTGAAMQSGTTGNVGLGTAVAGGINAFAPGIQKILPGISNTVGNIGGSIADSPMDILKAAATGKASGNPIMQTIKNISNNPIINNKAFTAGSRLGQFGEATAPIWKQNPIIAGGGARAGLNTLGDVAESLIPGAMGHAAFTGLGIKASAGATTALLNAAKGTPYLNILQAAYNKNGDAGVAVAAGLLVKSSEAFRNLLPFSSKPSQSTGPEDSQDSYDDQDDQQNGDQ